MGNTDTMIIRESGSKAAILLLHGFSGRLNQTWESFLPFLKSDPVFREWDIISLGYPTSLWPDFPGWDKDPSIGLVAQTISTLIEINLKKYEAFAFVAHSMGGLVAQKICVSAPHIEDRVSHVIHYGTPSNGLKKARPFGFLKKQIKDMREGSDFITSLRADWGGYQDTPGFPEFMTVAGSNDDFVPKESSLDPFPSQQQMAIPGNHLGIVSPKAGAERPVEVLRYHLSNHEYKLSPVLSAALAVEQMQFNSAVATFESHANELDEEAFVLYALALDGVGRTEDAIEILEKNTDKGTDVQGVLAGRLKRRWLSGRRANDAERAYELYRRAFDRAHVAGNDKQCHYHAINVAFLALAYAKDRKEMETWANSAIHYAARCKDDPWAQATIGEGYLFLGDFDKSHAAYKEALQNNVFSPREVTSTLMQAANAGSLLKADDFVERLIALLD